MPKAKKEIDIQVEFKHDTGGYAPAFVAMKVEYGPHLLKLWQDDEGTGRIIEHSFPWVNVQTVREWKE